MAKPAAEPAMKPRRETWARLSFDAAFGGLVNGLFDEVQHVRVLPQLPVAALRTAATMRS